MKLFAAPCWAYLWIGIVLFLTAIPHLIGILQSTSDKSFSAIVQEPPEDVHVYFSAMVQGGEGHILYTVPFTSLDFQPAPLYTIYTVMGVIADSLKLSNGLVFQVTRLLFSFLFLLAAYQVVALCLDQPNERKLAFGLLLFTQGIGWLFSIFYANAEGGVPPNLHVDLWYDEVSGYGTIIDLPHFSAISFFMIWMILAGIKALETDQRSSYIQAMLAGVGVAIIHNFRLVPIGIILGVYGLTLWREKSERLWRVIAKVGLMMLPAALWAIYVYMQLFKNEYFSTILSQTHHLTPPLWTWFITYGPIMVLVLAGCYWFYRERPRQLRIIVIWFVAIFVLLYLPTSVRRRFGATLHIPVVILATYGWYRVAVPLKIPRFVLKISLVFVGMSIVFSVLINATAPSRSAFTFRTSAEQEVDNWLIHNSDEDDIVLSAFETGNSLPAYVPIRTFVGQLDLTPNSKDRLDDVEQFFAEDSSDDMRIALLTEHHLDYVYYGSYERELGDFDPTTVDYLVPVAETDSITLFAVQLD